MPAWGGLCLRNQWNLVSRAVGAPSATGGSGWKGRGAERSKSFTQLVFEAACMKDSFEGERWRLTEGFPPPTPPFILLMGALALRQLASLYR